MKALDQSPFGSYAPNAIRETFRTLTHRLPPTYAGRKLSSLLLGPAGGRTKCPRDVTIFETEKARLHPFDNICEKRVYATPQFWDDAERVKLAAHIAANSQADFYFLDVGANAGLYTLFARAETKKARKILKAACIEPDPEMRSRLAFNVAASNAQGEIRIFPYAATAVRGPLGFKVNVKSRGLSKVDESGSATVQGAPLTEIIQAETGFPRIDAMKIDIEGHEFPALDAFFKTAPKTLFPSIVILEISHDDPQSSALTRCKQAGYRVLLKTKMNAVLKRRD